jgi:hypothetical protein
MLRRGVRFFVAALICSISTEIEAQPPQDAPFIWLRQDGAEQCPSEIELRQLVSEAIGRDPFLDPAAPRVRGSASREGEDYVARLWLLERPGATPVTRELRAPATDCAALSAAIVLALSLSLDAFRARNPRATQPRNANVARVPRAALGEPAAVDSGVTSRGQPGPWSALGGVEWSLGLLPMPTTGFGIAMRYAFGERVSAAAGGQWMPPASREGQFSVGLAAGKLGGCVLAFRSPRWEASGCAYAQGGALHVKDEAGATRDPGTHPWFAGALTGDVRTRLADNFVAEAGAGTSIPLHRPVFQTRSCPLVGFQQPPLTLAIFLAGGVIF